MHTLRAEKTWYWAKAQVICQGLRSQGWVEKAHWARGWVLYPNPFLSFLGPLLHDKPEDINRSLEMTSGPCLGKLALEQHRLGWKVVHQRQNFWAPDVIKILSAHLKLRQWKIKVDFHLALAKRLRCQCTEGQGRESQVEDTAEEAISLALGSSETFCSWRTEAVQQPGVNYLSEDLHCQQHLYFFLLAIQHLRTG